MTWKFTQINKKVKPKNVILIEGLPGIGNVGKISIDFIMNELKAKKFADIFSYDMPSSVFVNEENTIEMPIMSLYHKQFKKKDFLFLVGDFQPTTETACYDFCDNLIKFCLTFGLKQIITTGGVGLATIPENPKIFCTGNDKTMINQYTKGTSATNKLFGHVGPIVGVSGLLLGLSAKEGIKAITLLAETYGHPMFLGIKGSREIVEIINKKLKFKLNVAKLDKEIKNLEKEMKKSKEIKNIEGFEEISDEKPNKFEPNYIG